MNWKRQQTAVLPNKIFSIRYIENHIFTCQKNGIAVYTPDLQHVDTIPAGSMGWVFDVCSTPSGELVVATAKGLYHTKGKGECSLD